MPETPPVPPAAAAPRPAPALDRLAAAYVDLSAPPHPLLAPALGVPGRDAEVTDHSPAAVQERADAARALLARAAEVPDEDAADTVTRAALTERLGLEIERAEQRLDIAAVNNLASVLQSRDV